MDEHTSDQPPPPTGPALAPPVVPVVTHSPLRVALLVASVLGWVCPLLFVWSWPTSEREGRAHPGDQVVRAANWISVAGGVLVLAWLALAAVLGLAIGALGVSSWVVDHLAG